MKKILILNLFLWSMLIITTSTTYKSPKVFIESSKQGVFTASTNTNDQNTETTDDYVMSIVLGYEPFDYQEIPNDLSHESYLEMSKAYHTELNQSYLEQIDMVANSIYVSEYTPFIFYSYDEENLGTLYEKAVEISRMPFIHSIYLYQENLYESQHAGTEDISNNVSVQSVNATDSRQYITYDNFPQGTSYTGQNIKIGILDTGIFNPNHDNFSDIYAEVTYDTYTSNNNLSSAQHPTWVASILGGKYGIANHASLYYVDVNSQSGFTAVEKLINKGVHVINMSIANKSYYNNGTFDSSQEAYLDYIYTATKIPMVASTGNSLNVDGANGYISLPALSSNVIAVGSINEYGKPSSFSSYFNKNDIQSKPSLVAVGEYRNIPGFGIKSGTSFSAPAVTGALALLTQKKGALDMPKSLAALGASANPNIIDRSSETIALKSYNASTDTYSNTNLTRTVTNIEKSGAGLVERTGAGALDIEKLLTHQGMFPLPMTLNGDDVVLHPNLRLEAGQTITISLAWQRNATKKTEWLIITKYTSEPLADLDLLLAKTSGETIKKMFSAYTNNEILRFTVTQTDRYRIKFVPYAGYQNLTEVSYAYMID